MDVIVDDVVLKGPSTTGGAGHMVMFVYTAGDVQPAAGSAVFKVAIDGGDGPDTADGPAPIGAPETEGESPAITVGEARSRFRYGVCGSRWGYSSRFYREYPYLHLHPSWGHHHLPERVPCRQLTQIGPSPSQAAKRPIRRELTKLHTGAVDLGSRRL